MQEAEAAAAERAKAGAEAGGTGRDEGEAYAYQHALNLIRGILNPDPQTRYKLSQVSAGHTSGPPGGPAVYRCNWPCVGDGCECLHVRKERCM